MTMKKLFKKKEESGEDPKEERTESRKVEAAEDKAERGKKKYPVPALKR